MSPLTATLKCPHERGEDTNESEAVIEVASSEDGGGREDHLEGGKEEDRCVLPTGQTDSTCRQRKGDQRIDSRQYGLAIPPSTRRGVTAGRSLVISGDLSEL